MKNRSAIRWTISLIVAVLGIGVAEWQGWIQLFTRWGDGLLRKPLPLWVTVAALALLMLAIVTWSRRHSGDVTIPRETVRIMPQPGGHEWHMGSVDGRPAMQVTSRWFCTNITKQPVRLLGSYLTRPRTRGSVAVKDVGSNFFGLYDIPPQVTTQANAHFWVQPPTRKAGQAFTATVVIVDQFGNEHKVKNVDFRGERPPVAAPAAPSQESIHAIADPVERNVAEVLKDEVNRFRSVDGAGALGSIRTTYRGRIMTGFGTDWRRADSPRTPVYRSRPRAGERRVRQRNSTP
jgi:hypothetical protein